MFSKITLAQFFHGLAIFGRRMWMNQSERPLEFYFNAESMGLQKRKSQSSKCAWNVPGKMWILLRYFRTITINKCCFARLSNLRVLHLYFSIRKTIEKRTKCRQSPEVASRLPRSQGLSFAIHVEEWWANKLALFSATILNTKRVRASLAKRTGYCSWWPWGFKIPLKIFFSSRVDRASGSEASRLWARVTFCQSLTRPHPSRLSVSWALRGPWNARSF